MNGKIAYLEGGRMKLMEHTLPDPEPGAILVRVLSSNICGSDVKNWKGGSSVGVGASKSCQGHEFVGRIEVLGEGVTTDYAGQPVKPGDRIVAAKCILPVTQSDVPKSYGTRHRAAIGMSEISDAIIIVVSEETGGISIAQSGELRRDIDPVRLQQTLQRYLTINTRKRSKKEVAE